MAVQQTLTDARGSGGGGHGSRPYGGFGGVATTLHTVGGWRPGVGGIVQRPYNKDQGFCVFWDYLTGLPKRSGSKIIGKVGKATLLDVVLLRASNDRRLSLPYAVLDLLFGFIQGIHPGYNSSKTVSGTTGKTTRASTLKFAFCVPVLPKRQTLATKRPPMVFLETVSRAASLDQRTPAFVRYSLNLTVILQSHLEPSAGAPGLWAVHRKAAARQDAFDAMDRHRTTSRQERSHRKAGDILQARNAQHVSRVSRSLIGVLRWM